MEGLADGHDDVEPYDTDSSITEQDGADGTKSAVLIQLLIATVRDRDKSQAMHMIWVADREKYTSFLDELSNDLLKGNKN